MQVLRDAHLRQVHDQQLMLHDMRQTVNYQDELALEEMDEGEHEGGATHLFVHLKHWLIVQPQAPHAVACVTAAAWHRSVL